MHVRPTDDDENLFFNGVLMACGPPVIMKTSESEPEA
jgi:hypothetical protein